MFGLITTLAGVGGRMVASAAGNILSTALTEKVVKKILIILISKLVASSKNKLDDSIWGELKKELEKT